MASLRLVELFEHPLKSGRGNSVPEALVKPEGLALDRRFLVHTPDGTFISGRSHPRLVLISIQWKGQTLRLHGPGQPELVVVPTATHGGAEVKVWRDQFQAWDQGDEPARWLSAFLGDEVRLAWLGESTRTLLWDRGRRLTFADAAPVLAIGAASLEDLSRRVGEALSMRRFRPNFVIDGAPPFEEDSWRRVKIGEVEFLHLDGCGRCDFTTIDPETAERHPRGEPVATLEQYRRVDTGIYFGMNLMPMTSGTVRVGDPVTVLDTRRPLFFGPVRPLVGAIASWEANSDAVPWPEGPARLVCTAVRDEAAGVKTFSLVRADGLKSRWNAGQYLTLKIDLPDGPVRRSYSISSAPGTGIEITVKRLEAGLFSTWIHDHLIPGVSVVAEAVGGQFTLQDHPWDSLLFLGAGSGVTPLMAMLRWIAGNEFPVDVAFHQTARTRADLIFVEELETLQRTMKSRLTLGTRVTSEEGHWDHQGLVKFCSDYRDRRAFVCGPQGYRASIRELLAKASFKIDRRYHEEVFGEAALEVPEEAVPGTVTFARTQKSVPSDGKTTLLQLAERARIDVASSCRSGDCGTCRVKTSAGDWVLACHTFPQGDLALDL